MDTQTSHNATANAVVVVHDSQRDVPGLVPGVKLHTTGLTLPPRLTFEEWTNVGAWLLHVGRAINWAIGDWLADGERRYGETYAQAADVTGYEEPTLMTMAWVARKVTTSIRSENLSWSHHREVASLEDAAEMRYWLNQAEEGNWSVRMLRQELHRAAVAALEPEPIPEDDGTETSFAAEVIQQDDPDWPELVELAGLLTAVDDITHEQHQQYIASREAWPAGWEQVERVLERWNAEWWQV